MGYPTYLLGFLKFPAGNCHYIISLYLIINITFYCHAGLKLYGVLNLPMIVFYFWLFMAYWKKRRIPHTQCQNKTEIEIELFHLNVYIYPERFFVQAVLKVCFVHSYLNPVLRLLHSCRVFCVRSMVKDIELFANLVPTTSTFTIKSWCFLFSPAVCSKCSSWSRFYYIVGC